MTDERSPLPFSTGLAENQCFETNSRMLWPTCPAEYQTNTADTVYSTENIGINSGTKLERNESDIDNGT